MPQAPESLSVLLVEDDEDDYVITRDLLAEQTRTRFELEWVCELRGGAARDPGAPPRRLPDRLPPRRVDRPGPRPRMPSPTRAQAPVIVLTGKAELRGRPGGDAARGHGLPGEGAARHRPAGALDPLRRRPPRRPSAELRQSQERYALAVRGANDGTWDWDLPSDRVYLSPRWKGMLGYDDEAIGDTSQEWLDRVHPDDVGRAAGARVDAHLEGAARTWRASTAMAHRDGSYRWVLVRGAAIRDQRGQSDPRGRLDDRHHRPQGGRGASAPRRRSTTASPGCPTGRCSSTAWSTRWPGPSASPTTAAPSCSWTSIGSSWSTTASATRRATGCWSPWPAG